MIDADLLALVNPLAYIASTDYFIDIGTPSSFMRAQADIPALFPDL